MSEQTSPPPTGDAPIFDAFWSLVAELGWRAATLEAVARGAGLPLGGLRARFPCRAALLARHAAILDRVVIEGTVPEAPGSPRERVFDVLMRRFDAMAPHRAGLLRFLDELPRDPLTALALAPLLGLSMARMLEAAGVAADGPLGVVRVKGLGAVWLVALQAWRRDDQPDLSATMAALDRALDRAEQVARGIRLPDGDRQTVPSAQPPQPAAEA